MRERNPTVSGGLANAAAALRRGDAPAAMDQCRRLLRRDAANVPALELLYRAQLAAGERDAAQFSLERLIGLAPREIGYRRQLAMLHRQERRLGAAHQVLDEALAVAPSDAAARAAKAELHYLEGDYTDAAAVLGPCLGAGEVHPAVAQAYARLSPRIDARERAVETIRSALSGTEDARTRSRLLFELGHLLDALARYDEAFTAYREANELKGWHGDPDAYTRAAELMLASWSRAAPDGGEPHASEPVVFIVGMPRSGTSLVEQMLASHPGVYGGGERTDIEAMVRDLVAKGDQTPNILVGPQQLPARKAGELSARYAAQVRRAAGTHARLTDKAPFNFMHLGLIERVCARACVIHCVRDPLDTCVSVYFNNLVGMHVPPPDLRRIGERYRLYERVMAHWKDVVSLPILDVVYEELIDDPEAWARRIVEFAGLGWDDAVLRYHESGRVTLTPSADQVRRPVYQSSRGRWRNYEKHLVDLRAALDGADR